MRSSRAAAMSLLCAPLLVAVALAAVAGTAPVAVAAPAAQSAFSRWTLDFKPGDLRLYVDPTTKKAYWYMTYRVVNRTGDDRMWAPRFDLLSDDGQIQRSGRDVPSSVSRDLLKLLGNSLLEDQNQVIGQLLQGIEHAKDGLVVWPATSPNVTELSVFVSGLSGETQPVKNPVTGETVVLSKTLCRDYATHGNAPLQPGVPVELRDERWVWR
ncbi:MAG: hypothetical protein U0575_15675 [Phycisphaerales bacterium]